MCNIILAMLFTVGSNEVGMKTSEVLDFNKSDKVVHCKNIAMLVVQFGKNCKRKSDLGKYDFIEYKIIGVQFVTENEQ